MAEESIKMAFVQRALNRYTRDVKKAMIQSINTLDVIDSGDLKNSINTKVTSASTSNQGEAQIYFHEYGRMVDMGAGKSVSRKGKQSAAEKRAANKLRKPRKFYSPIAYGLLTPLINQIQYGLTEEVITDIKNELGHVS